LFIPEVKHHSAQEKIVKALKVGIEDKLANETNVRSSAFLKKIKIKSPKAGPPIKNVSRNRRDRNNGYYAYYYRLTLEANFSLY
jgi:hypothetical protein